MLEVLYKKLKFYEQHLPYIDRQGNIYDYWPIVQVSINRTLEQILEYKKKLWVNTKN